MLALTVSEFEQEKQFEKLGRPQASPWLASSLNHCAKARCDCELNVHFELVAKLADEVWGWAAISPWLVFAHFRLNCSTIHSWRSAAVGESSPRSETANGVKVGSENLLWSACCFFATVKSQEYFSTFSASRSSRAGLVSYFRASGTLVELATAINFSWQQLLVNFCFFFVLIFFMWFYGF